MQKNLNLEGQGVLPRFAGACLCYRFATDIPVSACSRIAIPSPRKFSNRPLHHQPNPPIFGKRYFRNWTYIRSLSTTEVSRFCSYGAGGWGDFVFASVFCVEGPFSTLQWTNDQFSPSHHFEPHPCLVIDTGFLLPGFVSPEQIIQPNKHQSFFRGNDIDKKVYLRNE